MYELGPIYLLVWYVLWELIGVASRNMRHFCLVFVITCDLLVTMGFIYLAF